MKKALKNLPELKEELSREIEHLFTESIFKLSYFVSYQTRNDPEDKTYYYALLTGEYEEEDGVDYVINKANEIQARVKTLLDEIAKHHDELADFYGFVDYGALINYKPEPCLIVDYLKVQLEWISRQAEIVKELLNYYIIDKL